MCSDDRIAQAMIGQAQTLRALAAGRAPLLEKIAEIEAGVAAVAAEVAMGAPGDPGALGRALASSGLRSRIDDCYAELGAAGGPGSAAAVGAPAITFAVEVAAPEACSCGGVLEILEDQSAMRCGFCRAMIPMVGAVFGDDQIYAQEGQKAKSGRFDPLRHLVKWMNNIFGLETDATVEAKIAEVSEQIRQRARAGREHVAYLQVADIRRHLQALRATALNEHVARIMSEVTGQAPPRLPPELYMRVVSIFSQIVKYEERHGGPGDHRTYYPDYIRRILDRILHPRDPLRGVLRYIHVQSSAAAGQNDAHWARILKDLSDIFEEWPYSPPGADFRARGAGARGRAGARGAGQWHPRRGKPAVLATRGKPAPRSSSLRS